ncbi:MAG TPA: hypothetical protein VKB57_11935, partial [Acidimicrobiales bacterium]|nr:hypothetical protein [Acidimicrobiales bacterium]
GDPTGGALTVESASAGPAPDSTTIAGFDPGAHTIAEVQDYVTANPAELDAVYAAEQAGKARVTLLDWLRTSGAT